LVQNRSGCRTGSPAVVIVPGRSRLRVTDPSTPGTVRQEFQDSFVSVKCYVMQIVISQVVDIRFLQLVAYFKVDFINNILTDSYFFVFFVLV